MEQAASSPNTDRRLLPAASALSLLLSMLSAHAFADTDVYRCRARDGKIEFRQTACATDTEEDEITVEDRKTGWEPKPAKIKKKAKSSRKSSGRERQAAKEDAAEARQEKQCWQKRHLLDEVNWKLRRGYRPPTGVKLRRRRRTYEDYIRRFCK